MSPRFLDAARWAVFVEALMPSWRAAHETLASPLPDDVTAKLGAVKAKQSAQRFIADWSPILFPEDDDGE